MEHHLLGLAVQLGDVRDAQAHEARDHPLDQDLPAARWVPAESFEKLLEVCVSNSFGFGGTNATLVFRAPPGGELTVSAAGS